MRVYLGGLFTYLTLKCMSHLLDKVKYISIWWLKKNDVNVFIELFGLW